jgi:hypothetical protein
MLLRVPFSIDFLSLRNQGSDLTGKQRKIWASIFYRYDAAMSVNKARPCLANACEDQQEWLAGGL